MSRIGREVPVHVDRFPRVSGDEPLGIRGASVWVLFSPRERG